MCSLDQGDALTRAWLEDHQVGLMVPHYADVFISSTVNTVVHWQAAAAATGGCCYGCCRAPRDNEERGERDKDED